MCGIVGIYGNELDKNNSVLGMLNAIKHRGYDAQGCYNDGKISLGHVRLAIVGLSEGAQPIYNEDKTIISVANAEIYNYQDLAQQLKKSGHYFEDACDTNLIPHLYEEYGCGMFEKINGQFAIAIWDRKKEKLILARDKFGEKPLYYLNKGQSLYFSSELTPLLKYLKDAVVDVRSLVDISSTWSIIGEKTFYEGISIVDCGTYIIYDGEMSKTKYFSLNFKKNLKREMRDFDTLVQELDLLLDKAIEQRMLTDVPVAFYLSGGLDSSLLIAKAQRKRKERINTFSIAFTNTDIDEYEYQKFLVKKMNTNHHQLVVNEQDIINGFFDVIPYVNTPLMRLGAIPMYLLSKFVHENEFKVAISGEGADELFGGYDIFKEVKIRDFCEKNTNEKERAILYKCTNSYVKGFGLNNYATLNTFYNRVHSTELFSSHLIRFSYANYINQFFTEQVRKKITTYSVEEELKKRLPREYSNFSNISKAQFLEIDTFLTNYLLASQGDRVAMANTVECRYPFLDADIIDFAMKLEDQYKLYILNEKYLLKQVAKRDLPIEIVNRTKFPYRAMITGKALLKDERVREALSEYELENLGIFKPDAVRKFIQRIEGKQLTTEKELMLLTFIISVQVLIKFNRRREVDD